MTDFLVTDRRTHTSIDRERGLYEKQESLVHKREVSKHRNSNKVIQPGQYCVMRFSPHRCVSAGAVFPFLVITTTVLILERLLPEDGPETTRSVAIVTDEKR